MCALAVVAGWTTAGAVAQTTAAGDTIVDALFGGHADLRARYRFERVSQAGTARKGVANTLLLRPGYTTGDAFGLSARIDIDTIAQLGKERFNDTVNGKTDRPVIADPDTVELNQAYLKFTGIPGTVLMGGRQRIKLDNDRFIGNVGFRQNEQTFDAATIINETIDHLQLRYVYIDSVQRIFGEQAVAGDFNTSNHLLHFAYKRFSLANITGYAYLLDIDDSGGRFSTETFGVRLTGKHDLGGPVFPIRRNTPNSRTTKTTQPISISTTTTCNPRSPSRARSRVRWPRGSVTKFSKVMGRTGFQTVLATQHAFQGWADKFLTTPATGIEDLYGGASYKISNVLGLDFIRFVAVYHEFDADTGGRDLGDELDLLASARFMKSTR